MSNVDQFYTFPPKFWVMFLCWPPSAAEFDNNARVSLSSTSCCDWLICTCFLEYSIEAAS